MQAALAEAPRMSFDQVYVEQLGQALQQQRECPVDVMLADLGLTDRGGAHRSPGMYQSVWY